MRRAKTLTTEAERQAFEKFLLAHSGNGGRQCGRHPSIGKLTYRQLREVMVEELGFAPTRQCVTLACQALSIPRRRRPGPPAGAEESLSRRKRHDRWYNKTRRDPVAWAAYLKRKRIDGAKARTRRRKDPKRHEAFLRRRRVYMRKYRRDHR